MAYTPAKNILIGLAILLSALAVSATIVFADDVNTSVSVGNATPTISNITFNGGNNVTLNENTSVSASTTITVSDANGCSDISSVTAKFFRGATNEGGTTCSSDDNNCYLPPSGCTATTTGNTCDGGSDTTVEYDCGFTLWYTADPTDVGSAFASNIWIVAATSTDGAAGTGTATNTAETIEVSTLTALNVTASIAYGSVAAGSNTGATNQSTTITNTGNEAIDSEVSGDVMCTDYPTCSGNSFTQDQQKFDTTDTAYGSLTNTLAATSSPANIELVLAKPTATTTAITDLLYWGIAIPGGQPTGSYSGQNTFTAVSD